MLTLPSFEYHAPTSIKEALRILQDHPGDALLMAGGTDLLPNLKHRLATPGHVVGLRAVAELRGITEEKDGGLRLGALTPIAELARNPLVAARLPSLAEAAAQVAGPQLREMGTLGGNLCLDTRCVYINQTYFWRKALGFCLKKDGTVCHVVAGGKNCVAAASNDTAPVLLTLGAVLGLVSPEGERTLPLGEFYVTDGINNKALRPGEILRDVRVPRLPADLKAGYSKLRMRAAIDFPALSVAVALRIGADERVAQIAVVVSALAARPHSVRGLDKLAVGQRWSRTLVDQIGAAAQKQCHPLTNLNVDPEWRHEVLPVYLRKAFKAAGALPA
jgi:4-hydroxybenzoyl-CoA reductase subunit beta